MNSPAVWSDATGDPSGPLVVVIHGSMDRSAGMLKVARQLDDRAHVLRYDRRGYGRSCPHDGPYGMHQQVDDLAALLADRAAVLVGHSYGGNVALATAARPASGRVDLRVATQLGTVVAGHDGWRERTRHPRRAGRRCRGIHAPVGG